MKTIEINWHFMLILLCVFVFSFDINGQNQAEISLSQQDNGVQHYLARDKISLLPGYKYHANQTEDMSAHIDESLICPIQYLTEPISVENREFDYNLPVGSLPGSVAVTPTGAAVYSIPIEVPPGTNGMQPNLSVNYNSQGGDGIFGIKWQLSGLSSISRTPRDIFHDGDVANINFTYDDRLSLDGNRLVIVGNDSYGADQSMYHTELESFTEITSHGSAGNGPSYFTQLMANGTIVEYGNTNDSKIEAQGRSEILFWLINKVTDVWGNSMEFFYVENNLIGEFYIDRIEYTKNASAGLNNSYNCVKFLYEEKIDIKQGYVNESLISSSKVIAKIQTICEGTRILEYDFDYFYDGYKTKLVKCILKNKVGDYYNPTVFEWGIDGNLLEPNISYCPYTQKNRLISVDVNLDGKSELFSQVYDNVNDEYTNHWDLFKLNESTGTFNIIDFNNNLPDDVIDFYSGDIDGDGHYDIIISYKKEGNSSTDKLGLKIFYGYTSPNFSVYEVDISNYEINEENEDHKIKIADFNSDGKDEVLILYDDGISIWKSLVLGFEYNLGLSTNYISNDSFTGTLQINDFELGDFNGDGIIDLIYLRDIDCQIYQLVKNQTTNWNFAEIEVRSFPNEEYNIFPGDFNGDGKTDLLVFHEDEWYQTLPPESSYDQWDVYITQGNSFSLFTKPNIYLNYDDGTDGTTDEEWGSDYIRVFDINNDGKSDIIEGAKILGWSGVYQTYSESYHKIYQFNGIEWQIDSIHKYGIVTSPYYGIQWGDYKGNGSIDMLLFSEVANEELYEFLPSTNLFNIEKISNGYNSLSEISYSRISDQNVYSIGSQCNYPVKQLSSGIQVVSYLSIQNSVGSYNNIQYKYQGAKFHTQGRGFFGFDVFTEKNVTSNFMRQELHSIDPVNYLSYLSQEKVFCNSILSSSTVRSLINNKFFSLQTAFNCNSLTPLFNQVVSNNIIANTSSSSIFTYDNYGNQNVIEEKIYNNGQLEWKTQTSYNNFIADGSFYPNKPQSVVIASANMISGSSHVKSKSLYYDTDGVIISEVNNNNDPILLTSTTFSYDDFGNNITVSVTGVINSISETITTSTQYDEKGRFPVVTINALGHEFHFEHLASNGQVIASTDPNTLTSINEYDDFGRLIKTIGPVGNVTNIERHWYEGTDIDNAIIFIQTNSDINGISYQYLNNAGQVLKSIVSGFNNSVAKDFEYNNLGQLIKTSYPYYSNSSGSSEFVEMSYDLFGRIITSSSPNENISYSYDGLITINSNLTLNQAKYSKTDALGNLIEVQDISGNKIYYEYNAQGLVESIIVKDVNGNQLSSNSIEYDNLGNQILLSDPNAGTMQYSYNASGMLLTQTDGNSNQFTFTYDKLGRVIHSSDGGTEIYTYTYDNSDYGIGMLSSIAGTNGYLQTNQYDQFSRLISSTERIDGVNFTNSYVYNNVGQLVQEIYPSNFSIKNHYDNHGILYKITKENGDPLWEMTAINEMGQITDYQLGDNGINCTNSYDSYHLLQAKSTINFNQDYLQHLSYSFDQTTGNLLSRSDLKNSQSESFTYDPLINKQLASSQIGSNTISVEYDVNGNILKKSDACGIDGYEYDLVKVHALTRVNEPTEQLEAQSISYNSYNQPSSIVQGLDQLELFYGSDGQRRKTILSADQIQQKTKYFIGNYEKVIDHITNETKEYFYLSSPSGLMAVATKTDGTNLTYRYILTDHLGSIQTIVNEAGIVENEYSYDPWGRSRNANDWSINSTSIPEFSRGFTGHEHLLEFGLINMNGRLYDPLIGRMLSPDNFVQNPENSLGFNRYTYAGNNPLLYTDPNGEFILEAIFIGMWVNTLVQSLSGNINSPQDVLFSMGVGALSGATGAWAGGAVASALGISSTLGGSILNGAISGAVGGFTGGFVNGAGNAWVNGVSFSQGVSAGLISGGYGALGGTIIGGISGGIQYQRRISVFQKGCVDLGVNGGDPVPATDQFLSDAQKAWYKDAPMNNVKAFTVENVPESHLSGKSGLITNNAPAKTVPLSVNKVFTGNSNVYFNKNLAFSSAKQLFFTMGHEFVHVSQFAALAGEYTKILYQPGFVDLLEFHAYSYQHSLGGLQLNSFTPDVVRSLAPQYPTYFITLGYTNFGWTSLASFVFPF